MNILEYNYSDYNKMNILECYLSDYNKMNILKCYLSNYNRMIDFECYYSDIVITQTVVINQWILYESDWWYYSNNGYIVKYNLVLLCNMSLWSEYLAGWLYQMYIPLRSRSGMYPGCLGNLGRIK